MMALTGQHLVEWPAIYSPDAPAPMLGGWGLVTNLATCTIVTFSNVQILSVQNLGDVVEVTLTYGSVRKSDAGPNAGTIPTMGLTTVVISGPSNMQDMATHKGSQSFKGSQSL